MNKPRIIKDYDKLTTEVKEQIKLIYPRGFRRHLIPFTNKDGEKKLGLPFETEDNYYLVRMSQAKADAIIAGDDDFDDSGLLKASVLAEFEDKYDDEDFLNEYNSNDDNSLGAEDNEIEDLDQTPASDEAEDDF